MAEKAILNTNDVLLLITDALKSKVGERLNSYNSPLNPIVDEVVKQNAEKLKSIVQIAMASAIADKKFVEYVKQEFNHKVAKLLVGKLEGSVEKAVEVLRQDPTLRSRIILAIEGIINENQKV